MTEKKKDENSSSLERTFPVVMHNFFKTAKHLLWLAILISLAFGGYRYYTLNRSYVPQYSSSVVFSVQANYSSTIDVFSRSVWLDSNAAQTLSQTFPYFINSENTRMLLLLELNRDTINASITAKATADVGLFTMTVTSNNAQDAFDIMNAAIAVYPQAASSILGETQIHIINLPQFPPTKPDNPNTAFSTAARSTIPAFLFCMVLIFLLSLTRKTVHSAEDLHKLISLKCLAYIPSIRIKKHSKKTNLLLTINNSHVGTTTFNESIRNLRVHVQKIMKQSGMQILLITSTLPNEGKTTIATNLALSLAQEGRRVILIDGDLRKQSLKQVVGTSKYSDGLVEILSGDCKNFRLLSIPDSTLLLLSGDQTTDQPQPLLDTPRMQQLLEFLKKKLDYIIIDTPPAGILSDAATLAKYADATLYIVRQDLANTAQIANSIQTLSASGTNLIGCVLNRTESGTTRYGYSSKYSYGYGYGYKCSGSYYAYGHKRHSRYDVPESDVDELTQQINESVDIPLTVENN